MASQSGLFDVDDRLQRLSDLGDQLETFSAAVDFELFRAELMRALAYSDGSRGGRPPFDPVKMFKLLVIQTVNTLSDERCEYLINDRLSFMRFLGLGLSDRVLDARTIWLFREKLTKAGAIQPLFDRFDMALRAAGYIAMSGQIVRRQGKPIHALPHVDCYRPTSLPQVVCYRRTRFREATGWHGGSAWRDGLSLWARCRRASRPDPAALPVRRDRRARSHQPVRRRTGPHRALRGGPFAADPQHKMVGVASMGHERRQASRHGAGSRR